ncbi:MAG: CopD family protein [Kofleriaceae bacterium]|nr:CopD family protein [Kofleriaceae bacterium]
MTLYLASVTLHILAATVWLGGIGFIALVVVPLLRQGDRAAGRTLLASSGHRFRTIGWVCFALLLVTGAYNLHVRGIAWAALVDPRFLSTPYGKALGLKLGAVLLVFVLGAVHDFAIGPRALREPAGPGPDPGAETARRAASWMGRASAVLGILIVFFAVAFVRGW